MAVFRTERQSGGGATGRAGAVERHSPVRDPGPIKQKARELGFELAGIAAPGPTLEALFYPQWLEQGYHGAMSYLAGRRGELRADARSLLPSARSVICLGMVYNSPDPYSTEFESKEEGWISRYAWGEDYHGVLQARLRELADWIRGSYGSGVECKACVDTSPLLERAYARRAGLGWIGKNCCLIDEQLGSWLFLGEILTSLELETDDERPYRCGTCSRCIDACPTNALVEVGADTGPSHALDSRRCISYWTIELRESIPDEHREAVGPHVFGCDICQDVCPWNSPRRAASSAEPAFAPANATPRLEDLASLSAEEFNARFAGSPIERSRYAGFLRNVAVAMGNSGNPSFREALERLAGCGQPLVREHAEWALAQLGRKAREEGEEQGAAE
ncbi:MAG: tRNA epoxyqueuosine(34) reductase QueG [Bryobacterales bacterium]|nr:tRNA epoxyqueuosine(34) reductase QueG [Bryobacterales bacterium]